MVSAIDTLAAFSRITDGRTTEKMANHSIDRTQQRVDQLFQGLLLRRKAMPEFSPAFQGRDRKCRSNHVASATIELIFQPSLTRRFVDGPGDPGLERPG